MKTRITMPHTLLSSALALALAGCGGGSDATAPARTLAANDTPKAAMSEDEMIDELASRLQACSYDGSPVTVNARGMASGQSGAGAQVVANIMKYTGLPQNFDVMPHPDVPNAAAVILIGEDKLPHRVIAYNEQFMANVRNATANNDWAPISIMAHEIGHHLSGHTIQPGGSQPPTELEADKFSGFVLYKMGAVLADAQKAMNTLVPEADGPTHPGRGKRVRAIADGWEQACSQQAGDCSGGVAVVAKQELTPMSKPIAANVGADVLPAPDANAIPSKFGKFVIDELGVLDATTRANFEQQMFDLAANHQVELVTIVAKSLHGLSADDYAYAMLRQLRVGKLDVGNGAVFVIAPNEKQAGVAMGASIMLEMRNYIDLEKDRLKSFAEIGLPYCKAGCNADQSEMVFAAAEHVAHDVASWDFNIRYQNLGALMAKFEETEKARMDGAEIEPEQDPTWRKITRVEGKLVTRNVAGGAQVKWINDTHAEIVGAPMHVQTADGRNLLIYADAHVEKMMTGKLVEGQSYVFIAREASLSQNPKDTLSFDLLSFDAVSR